MTKELQQVRDALLTDDEIAEAAERKYEKPLADFILNVKPEQLCRLAFIAGAHYARDRGHLCVPVDAVMEVIEPFIDNEAQAEEYARWNWGVGHKHWESLIADLRARLEQLNKP